MTTPTAPPALTTAPDFPALSDRAAGTYNSKAFTWASHWGSTGGPQVKALADNAYINATAAHEGATTATAKADAAALSEAAAEASALAADASADAIALSEAAAAASALAADASTDAAAAAAAAAQTYASLAQATNPDSPIRLNPRRIAANFTVPTGYNAASTGPITVAHGVAVTVATGAAWSVH